MSHEADELVLYADNDEPLYRQSFMPIVENLNKKVKKGTYSTVWHPTDRGFSPLSRGSFKTKADAKAWADEKLRRQPYTIKRIG